MADPQNFNNSSFPVFRPTGPPNSALPPGPGQQQQGYPPQPNPMPGMPMKGPLQQPGGNFPPRPGGMPPPGPGQQPRYPGPPPPGQGAFQRPPGQAGFGGPPTSMGQQNMYGQPQMTQGPPVSQGPMGGMNRSSPAPGPPAQGNAGNFRPPGSGQFGGMSGPRMPGMGNAPSGIPPGSPANMNGLSSTGSTPPLTNGPPVSQTGFRPPGMTSPPKVGQPYVKPGLGPPPGTQGQVGGPPRMGVPPTRPGVPGMGVTPPPNGQQTPNRASPQQPASQGFPNELPVPFHGQGQYSHNLGINWNVSPGITPNNSEPPSQRSSRAPSPIPGPSLDAVEGQFTPGVQSPQSGMQQPGFPGQPGYQQQPPGGHFPPGGQAPPGGQFQQRGPPPPGGQPPFGGPPPPGGQQPFGGQQPPPGGQQPPPPAFIPPMSQPQQQQQPTPPPGQDMGQRAGGITGKRVYPQMQQQQQQQQSQTSFGQPPMSQAGPGMTQAGMGQGMPQQQPQGMGMPQQPGMGAPSQPGVNQQYGQGQQQQYSQSQQYGGGGQNPNSMNYANSTAGLSSHMGKMQIQGGEIRPVNLLQERNIIPPEGVEIPKPNLQHDFKKVNCHPDVFRCTLHTIPQTQGLLNKCRLPLGILIHPFKDLSHLPVIQSSVIVRCRSCRTYINPFVTFVDSRRWRCNLCYRVNECSDNLPDEFSYDPVSKSYGDPQRRPEIKSSTIEFIAPSEYMLRPPQPAVYLYVIDVSFNAVETGYLQVLCQTILDELDRIPGDARTMIGFITFDRTIHFYNLTEGLSRPQMLVVGDLEEVFLPCADGLLVNLNESRDLVTDLLSTLPGMFEGNMETGSALGAALLSAYKLMSSTGGRVSVFQTVLPTVGPGALKAREDPNQRASKNVQHLGPANDFYKKLALDCSGQQIAVDLWMLNGQYADIATISCVSKYSGGSIQYYPAFHTVNNVPEVDRFENDLRRYLTRKIGFEAVMRIRCTKGLSLHTFHGNFFVRSTDLLSLPNINPDAGFGMQMSIEDTLNESSTACFQAALLYTSSKGERRIRVHTLCLPISTQASEIFAGADQAAIIGLLSKMAVDRSLASGMSDARDAMINAATDMLGAFSQTIPAAQRMGSLLCPFPLRLMPLYTLALLKSMPFRVGASTRLDERVFAMDQCKALPTAYLLLHIYPNLYPVHALDERNAINKNDVVIPQPPLLQLSSANIDRHGAYLMDAGSRVYLWIGGAISDHFCQEVLDVPSFASISENLVELPELENPTSEKLRSFVNHLQDQRPFCASFHIIREDSRQRGAFVNHMVEDRSETAMSYYEFLQHMQKEIKS